MFPLSLYDNAAFHHQRYVFDLFDIREWIPAYGNDIGELPCLQ